MKRLNLLFIFVFAFTLVLQAQDTTKNRKQTVKQVEEYDTVLVPKQRTRITFRNRKKVYRPTRLGSSSPLYDTYKRNDEGAGSVTTNPNKAKDLAEPVIAIPRKGLDSTVLHTKDSSGILVKADSTRAKAADTTRIHRIDSLNKKRNSTRWKNQ